MEISLTTFFHCIVSLKQILKVWMTRSTFQWSFYLFYLSQLREKGILYRLSSTSVDHLLDFLKSLSFSKQPVAPRTCEERVRTFARVEYEGQAGSDSVAPGAWLWIKAWFKSSTFPGDAASYSHALPAWSPAPSAGGLCLGFTVAKAPSKLSSCSLYKAGSLILWHCYLLIAPPLAPPPIPICLKLGICFHATKFH